jgi:hypothetical protein
MRSRERVRGGAPRAELGRSSRSLSSPSKKISWGEGNSARCHKRRRRWGRLECGETVTMERVAIGRWRHR